MKLHASEITGSLEISGSITPDGSGSHDLGSANSPWKDIHVMSSSIHVYDSTGPIAKMGAIRGKGFVFKDHTGALARISGSALKVTGDAKIGGTATADEFVGGGAGITGVTAEWDGTHTGNGVITGDLEVTGNISGSSTSTGSFGRVEVAGIINATATGNDGIHLFAGHLRLPNGSVQCQSDSGMLTSGASQDIEIGHDGSNSFINHKNTGDLELRTNEIASAKIRLKTSVGDILTVTGSNVGIGTTSPASNLHVEEGNLRQILAVRGGPGEIAAFTESEGAISGDHDTYILVGGYRHTNNAINISPLQLGYRNESTRVGYIKLNGGTDAIVLDASGNTTFGGTISSTDSAVTHGMTGLGTTNTYSSTGILHTSNGGVQIRGMSDNAAGIGIQLYGTIGVTDPTDTVAAIEIRGSKKNGTGHQALAATETVLKIGNLGTSLITVLGSGNTTFAGNVTGTFVGNITGNVTGNTSGTAATVTTAAQPAITSVGTLTSFRSTGIDDNADALAITIDSSERVGIGTTSPDAPLHISGGTAMNGSWGRTLTLAHNFPGIAFQSEYSTDAWAYIGYDNTTGMKFFVNADSNDVTDIGASFTILDDGKVGIGTESPDQTLHIHRGSAGSVSSDSNTVATFENSGTAMLQMLSPDGATQGILFGDVSDNNIGKIQYEHTGNYLSFVTNTTEALKLDSSQNATFAGNVTIARSGNASLTVDATGGGGGSSRIYLNAENSGAEGGEMYFQNDASTKAMVHNHRDGHLYFKTGGTTLALTLDSSQNATFAGTIGSGAITSTAGIAGTTGTFSGAVTATTLDTGQGANELYDMDQNVMQASDVTFDDLILTGNLTVNGSTTTINTATLSVDDKNIELGSVATPSDATANLGGITLKGATDKTILWTNATDSWNFNQNIKLNGSTNPTLEISAPSSQRPIINFDSGDATEAHIYFQQSGTTKSYIQGGRVGDESISFFTGGTTLALKVMADLTTKSLGNIEMPALKKLYLDGGSNTYISEFAGDKARVVAGGQTAMSWVDNNTYIPALGKLFFDGNAGITGTHNNYMYLSATNILDIYTAGVKAVTINATQNATFAGTIGSGAITSTAGISGTTGTFTGDVTIASRLVTSANIQFRTGNGEVYFYRNNHNMFQIGGGGAITGYDSGNSSTNYDLYMGNPAKDKKIFIQGRKGGSIITMQTFDSATGNVGIGTTSPAYAFTVNSDSSADGNVGDFSGSTNGGFVGIRVANTYSATDSLDETSGIQFKLGGGDAQIIAYKVSDTTTGANRDVGLKFYTQDSNSMTTTLTLANNKTATFAGNIQMDGTYLGLGNGTHITCGDSGSGDIHIRPGGTNYGGYINLRAGGNSGDIRMYTGTSGTGTLALTINSSQNATFAGTIGSGAITSTGYVTGTSIRVSGNCYFDESVDDNFNVFGASGVKLNTWHSSNEWRNALLLDTSQNATFSGQYLNINAGGAKMAIATNTDAMHFLADTNNNGVINPFEWWHNNAAIDGGTKLSHLSNSGDLWVKNDLTVAGGAITATTLDTGQGANVLYDMNQNVKTDSTVTFNAATISDNLTMVGGQFYVGGSSGTDNTFRLREIGGTLSFGSRNSGTWNDNRMTLNTSGNLTVFGNLTASTGNATFKNTFYETNNLASAYYGTVDDVDDSAWFMGVNVSGYLGMSAIRMTVKGTSTNHLHSHTVDILYNHYQDVFVKSWSGAYSTLYLKIVGNSGEDFDIFFKSSTGSVSPALAADLIITIEPLSGKRSAGSAEWITFTTTSANYTGGATHEHACIAGYHQSATDGSTTGHAHMKMDGNLTVNGTGTSTFAGDVTLSAGDITVINSDTDSAAIWLDNTSTNGDAWRLASNGAAASPGVGAFSIYNSDTDTYGLTILNDAKVGIGTTSPAFLANAKGLVIAGTGGRVDAAQNGTERIPTLRITDTVTDYGSNTATLQELRGGIEFVSSETSGTFGGGNKIAGAIYAVNEDPYNRGGGLSFYTNENTTTPTERMRIGQNGSVGIGTTVTTSYKLEVNGTLGSGAITSTGTITGTYGVFDAGDVSLKLINGNDNFYLWQTYDNGNLLYLKYNSTQLYSYASATATWDLRGTWAFDGSATVGGTLGVTGNATFAGNVSIGSNSTNYGDLTIWGGNQALGGSGWTATDADQGQLYVVTTDAYGDNIGGCIAFGGSVNSSAGTNIQTFGRIHGKKDPVASAGQPDGYMVFETVPNSGTMTERMRITSTGNVVIGNTNANARLHVQGLDDATTLIVSSPLAATTDWNGIGFGIHGTRKAGIFFIRDTSYSRGRLKFCIDNTADTSSAGIDDTSFEINSDKTVIFNHDVTFSGDVTVGGAGGHFIYVNESGGSQGYLYSGGSFTVLRSTNKPVHIGANYAGNSSVDSLVIATDHTATFATNLIVNNSAPQNNTNYLQVKSYSNDNLLVTHGDAQGRIGFGVAVSGTTLYNFGGTMSHRWTGGGGVGMYINIAHEPSSSQWVYGNVLAIKGAITVPASSANPWHIGTMMEAPSITSGSGTVTNSATLRITGAMTHATYDYSLYVDSGDNYFGGSTSFGSTIEVSGNATLNDVLPSVDGTKDLGSPSLRWANVYTGDLHLKNEVGDWTVEEGAEELFIRNNLTGKKYAIMMKEVE